MRTAVRILAAMVSFAILLMPIVTAAQQRKVDVGKDEYDTHCAVCHGMQGKGDGLYAGFGSQKMTSLTTLAKRNNGVFPFARVYQTIDGTADIQAHGSRDMPIWGTDYRTWAAERYSVYNNPEAFVRARILALTEYVYRLQEK